MSKMQIKRHCLLIEVMHSEYFFSGVGLFASCSASTSEPLSTPIISPSPEKHITVLRYLIL